MKPAITGWLRKFARKPRRITPITVSKAPDINANVPAASATEAASVRPRFPIAAAVISETTATGPTASARLVPKTA